MQNTAFRHTTFTLLFVALLLAQQVSHAQSRQRWSFGPRLGLNLTNFVGSDAPTQNPFPTVEGNRLAPGLSAGVGFMYSDVSHFGFGIDLLYAQRGNRERNTSPRTNEPETVTNRVNYLELPITLRYFLNDAGNFRPNLFVGAVPALRLNARRIASGNGISTSDDFTNRYKEADLGLTAGFQLNWRVANRQRFTVDGRYTHGLTNISNVVGNLRNQQITIGLGYNFGIGRQYRPGDRKIPDPTRAPRR